MYLGRCYIFSANEKAKIKLPGKQNCNPIRSTHTCITVPQTTHSPQYSDSTHECASHFRHASEKCVDVRPNVKSATEDGEMESVILLF